MRAIRPLCAKTITCCISRVHVNMLWQRCWDIANHLVRFAVPYAVVPIWCLRATRSQNQMSNLSNEWYVFLVARENELSQNQNADQQNGSHLSQTKMPGQDGTVAAQRREVNRLAAKKSRELRRYDDEASQLTIEALTVAVCDLTQSIRDVYQSDNPVAALERLVQSLPNKDDLKRIQ